MFKINFSYIWETEIEDSSLNIYFDVEVYYYPYTPKIYDHPGDPAEIEITNVQCYHIVSDKYDREPTGEEAKFWEAEFIKEVDDNDYLYEDVLNEANETYKS